MADDFEFDGEESAATVKTNGLVEISNFKGNPVISLRRTPTDERPFTMGLTKCKLVLDNIDAIERFVQEHKKK